MREKSSLNSIFSTTPISTFLYLTLVLSTSIPSAVLKLIVARGPFSDKVFTINQPPTKTVIRGITQTIDGPD